MMRTKLGGRLQWQNSLACHRRLAFVFVADVDLTARLYLRHCYASVSAISIPKVT